VAAQDLFVFGVKIAAHCDYLFKRCFPKFSYLFIYLHRELIKHVRTAYHRHLDNLWAPGVVTSCCKCCSHHVL